MSHDTSLLQPRAISDTQRTLALAQDTLNIEADAVRNLARHLGGDFIAAHKLLFEALNNKGRVVVTGMGKSGHIGSKIASTLASTGTPAFFMHPAEASHGDLGMITLDDVVLALSNSGETAEIVAILPVLKRRGTKIIALTGNAQSTLALEADVHLDAGVEKEACPLNLAPTASTTAALALGDALAVTLLDARGFGEDDFAAHHPGGALGRRLLTHVRDVMATGEAIPQVNVNATLKDAIVEMSRKGLGMTAVVSAKGNVAGLFTDGDLRRTLEKYDNINQLKLLDVMTKNPITISPDKLATEAAQIMETRNVSGRLLVTDHDGKLVGALHVDALLRKGVL